MSKMTTLTGSNNKKTDGVSGTGNVDKGVCTNDVLEDLHRAIKFEAVFSTLIENKILSIKRECEEKRKQKRSLVRFLFGGRRRNVASIIVDPNIEAFPVESVPADDQSGQWFRVERENERAQPNPGHSLSRLKVGHGCNVDDDEDGVRMGDTGSGRGNHHHMAGETTSLNGRSVECSSLDRERVGVGTGRTVAVGSDLPGGHVEFEYKYDAISIQSDTCRTAPNLCLSNDLMYTTATTANATAKRRQIPRAQRDKRSQSDDFIARSNHSGPIRCSGREFQSRGVAKASATPPRKLTDSRTDCSMKRSQHGSKSILTSSSSSLHSNPMTEASPMPGTKVGHNNDHPNGNQRTTSNAVAESGPVKLGPREASALLEQERNRLRVFEMRSISAQCSPIMPRHIEFDNIVSLSNSAPMPLHPVQDEELDRLMEPAVIVPSNPTIKGGVDATPVKSHRRQNHKSKSQRAAEYLASQIDFDSLASYPKVNPKTQGIISSFNQLKSPNLPRIIPMRQQHPTMSNTIEMSVRGGGRTSVTGGEQQVSTSKGKRGGRDNNETRQSSEYRCVCLGSVNGICFNGTYFVPLSL